MPPSHPRDPKRPDGDPAQDRPEERRTLEMRAGGYVSPIDLVEDEINPALMDERDTVPPPLPVAEYVQTMMQQAETDDDDAPPSSRAPMSWRGEPPSSRAPMSWRGEPPLSLRARAQMDSASSFGGLRPQEPGPARQASASPPEDEFDRRPLSLRGGDAPRSPTLPEVWAPATPRSPLDAIEDMDVDQLLSPLRARRSPTQPSLQRPPLPAPRNLTPAGAPKASIGLPPRIPTAPAMPAITPSKPLPPAPVPRGLGGPAVTFSKLMMSGTPTGIPQVKPAVSSGSITRPVTNRPPNTPEDDAEIDALPFDDLVAASHHSSPPTASPPPTVVAPVPPPRAPVPAGLRLGKEPLSSFPPRLDEPELGDDDTSIPAILDVAWAFGGESLEESEPPRNAILPGADLHSIPTAFPPSPPPPPPPADDDGIPAILDAAWAFPKSSYDEANEITTVGTLEDDLDLEPVDEIEARFDEGDFAGALLLAERTLAQDPADERARTWAESARERLITEYTADLGGRRQIPHVIMSSDEIRWLSLDHRAGFLLSCIDGRMTIEEVLDVSCMPALDALRILCDLRDRSVISMEVDQARSTRR